MSYWLVLFNPKPGKDPVKTAKALLRRSSQPPSAHRSETKEQHKQRLIAALQERNPRLQRAPVSNGGTGNARNRTPSADREHELSRDLTLYDPPDESNFTITLTDHLIFVTVHFGISMKPDDQVLKELRGYLEVLQREGGYSVYDPQNERVVDVSTEFA